MRHRARRRFSQNFLVDRACIDRIVRSIAPSRGDHLVEIGPGLGALTEPLMDAVERMDAIEVEAPFAIIKSHQVHAIGEHFNVIIKIRPIDCGSGQLFYSLHPKMFQEKLL